MIIPAGLMDVKDTDLWIIYFRTSKIKSIFSSVKNFVYYLVLIGHKILCVKDVGILGKFIVNGG